jgi:hypothetical protein
MANQLLITPNRALDANAYASPAATATFYASGTSTLITVYSDEPGTIVASNPITADANGIFPQTYALVNAKVIVRDSSGATLWTIDPVPTTSTTAVGASKVSFAPTVDIPETNVQDAIEAAAAFAASGFTVYGLGNAGNAPTLSALNDTGTATGMYRFTGSTTGTFPTGVVAADTGLVTVDRQTASEAMMTLRAAGSGRVYVRFLTASVWQVWREIPTTIASATNTELRFLRMNAAGTGQEYTATINLETGVSASGTAVDFTGIPTAARRITVMMTGVSTSGSNRVRIVLGDSGGFETSGYLCASTSINGATAATSNYTGAFELNFGAGDTSAAVRSGSFVLDRVISGTGLTWTANGVFALSNTAATSITAGRMALTGDLDRVRITTTGGTDTFTSGVINISWEI